MNIHMSRTPTGSTRATRQLVEPYRDVVHKWTRSQLEGRHTVNYLDMVSELIVSQLHQHWLIVVQIGFSAVSADAQFFNDLLIEIFEQLLSGSRHGLIDLLAELLL
jgi:hypothetical protein